MTDLKNQQTLAEIFKKLIVQSDDIDKNNYDTSQTISINDDHFLTLCNTFNIADKPQTTKAKLCLALATMICRYTSSSFFGTESESPIALRNYALALLNKANQLDSHLIDFAKLSNWRGIFHGLKGQFSCTAVLSDKMKDYIKSKNDTELTKLFNSVYPPQW
jgi:hypothetical protein